MSSQLPADQVAAEPDAKELREGFARELEVQMVNMVSQLEQLIEMHDRYGDTLQKDYLYKARHALRDGLGWFEWSRRQCRAG